jgi:hypothetical protein
MAGIGAAALLIGMAAAHAQGVTAIDSTGTPIANANAISTDASGNINLTGGTGGPGLAGLAFTDPATTSATIIAGTGVATTNFSSNVASVTNDVGGANASYAGFLATTGYDSLSASLSAPGYIGTNAAGAQTVNIDNTSGNATFSGLVTGLGGAAFGSTGQATIDASGNIGTSGTISSTVAAGPNQGSTTINGANTAIQGPNGGTFGTTISDASALNNVYVGLAGGTGMVQIYNSNTSLTNTSTASGMSVTDGTSSTVAVGIDSAGAAGVHATDLTNGNVVSVGVNPNTGAAGSSVTTSTGSVLIGSAGTGSPTGIGVYSSAATGNLPEFTANSSGYISAHGNTIQDVGTPVIGTDAANKAYVDKGVNKAYEGTAIALAISQPVFLPGQSFAIRAGWGNYESQNAFGVSAAGVIARDVFGYGSTVALDGGVGVGGNYNGVAGKAGLTFGFGGGVAPLAPMK